MAVESPYLKEEVKTVIRKYNPKYGDARMCICGHPYYRHFDTYDEMTPIGCKYCGCYDFKEAPIVENADHKCILCGSEILEPNLKVCDKCASEYEY